MNIDLLSPYVRHVRVHESRGHTPAYVDPDHVFTYIFGGEGAFLLEGVRYDVKAGDVLLLPPYMRHIINVPGAAPLGQYVAHFDPVFDPKRSSSLKADPEMSFQRIAEAREISRDAILDAPRVLSTSPRIRSAFESDFLAMRDAFAAGEPCDKIKVKALMLDILQLYFRQASRSGANGMAVDFGRKAWANLERGLNFIHANFQRQISLSEISVAACLSPNYFCALFKSYAGVPPHKYLNALRVKRAKLLIADGTLNFTQVALETGFPGLPLFSRTFKEVEGVSPSGYKLSLSAEAQVQRQSR